VKETSQSQNSTTSSSKLNSLDILSPVEYTSQMSEGGAMIPDALEYSNNNADIYVGGGSRKKKKLVKQAARWMLGYTLGTRMANNISLRIDLVDDLKNTNVYGSVLWADSNNRPREFDMDLCNFINDRTLFRVLAHEIVHIRQYATGDLKDLATHADYCKWKNKLIQSEGRGSGSYYDLPWEKEARADQEIIFRDWRRAHDYHFKQKSGELYGD
jgi:hypothetical protein